MAVLINGDGFSPVTAQMDADFYAGIWGTDLSVLNIGSNMAASIESATSVRIADGEAVIQGRRLHIDAGSYDEFTIPVGEQGVTRYYVIGYELYRDSENKELCRTFVQQVASESATVQVGGVLRDGATSIKVSMYRVTKNGVNIGDVTPLFKIPQILRDVFPVGAIYMSVNNTDPSTLFGGTWERISGRFLLAADSTYTAGSTGGEAKHTLTAAEMPAHTHTAPRHRHAVANHTHTIPAHTHTASASSAGAHTHALYRWKYAAQTPGGNGYLAQGNSKDTSYGMSSAGAHTHTITIGTKAAFSTSAGGNMDTTMNGDSATTSAGNSGAHNNMPPYLSVYMWKRTA